MAEITIDEISIKDSQPGEEGEIARLALRTFAEQVPEEFTEEGVQAFIRHVEPGSLAERLCNENCFAMNAWHKDSLVGTIGIHEGNSIFILFVDPDYEYQEISNALLDNAIAKIKSRYRGVNEILVQSSCYLIPEYEHLGFRTVGKVCVSEGIVSTQMRKNI